MINDPLNENGAWKAAELKLAFAGLGNIVVVPLGLEEIEGAGVGFTFYIGWGESDSRTYSRISEVVDNFHGLMNWSTRAEFNNCGAFISALPLTQARKSFSRERVLKKISPADLDHEIDAFCISVHKLLLDRLPSQARDRNHDVKVEPFEDSEYRVFLVAAPERFDGAPTSSLDRMLHFGITKEEWLILSNETNERVGSTPTIKDAFFSKLKQRYETALLSPGEVISLRNELDEYGSTASDATLSKVLRKLQVILLEASTKNLGVVFQPND